MNIYIVQFIHSRLTPETAHFMQQCKAYDVTAIRRQRTAWNITPPPVSQINWFTLRNYTLPDHPPSTHFRLCC